MPARVGQGRALGAWGVPGRKLAAPRGVGYSSGARMPFPFRRILIADDEPSERDLLSRVLSERGYEVRAVASGEAMLRELAARGHDVLLCDVRAPNALGLCEHVFDTYGCRVNVPGAYRPGVFESCVGDDQKPVQPGVTDLPATSSCTPFQSADLFADAVSLNYTQTVD